MTKRLLISLLALLCCCTGMWASSIPGALSGRFTINASGEKVVFSQGNLQYVGTWQFAENQWDCFSTSQYNDHRDLFGWGTGDAPNKVSGNDGDYGTFTDWGTNAITNGGNTENSGWRTLTKDEWVYLFYSRENAATLFGFGSVNSMNGLIILPDNWTTPEGASFTASTTLGLTNLGSYYHNDKNDNYTHNTYTAEQWAVMESAGAVFLPAAAYRHWLDSSIKYTDLGGFYWSSTPYDSDMAYYLNFYYNDLAPQFKEMRCGGRPVRLVRSSLEQDAEGNYLLSSADDWKDFAAIVNSGTNAAANAKMTADIDLGDDQTHIGSLAEGANPKYAGVFDGQGHTLTVNYVGGSNQIVAPFTQTNSATIKNLHIAGSIQSSFAYIGVVGIAGGSSVISKVWMSATMNTTQDGWVQSAAIAGYCEGSIQDCLFTGTFTSGSSGYMGGFYGYTNGSPTITNCLSTGTFNNGNWQGSGIHTNCYLKQYPTDLTTGCSWATNETLSDGTIATALQNGRAEEIWVQDPITNQPMLKLFATKAYTVPASGIGTFSAKAKFTVPDGLTAHYCKTYNSANSTIGVVDIDGAVPANTGVLLKGTPGETYTLTGTNNEAATVTGNALVAVTEATHVAPTDGEYTNFMLKSGTFIRIADSEESVKMPANKAYLQIQTSDLPVDSQLTRAIRLSWGGGVTDVPLIDNGQLIIDNYSLPAKRIVKGKLIIEKNGQMFNANGQLIK